MFNFSSNSQEKSKDKREKRRWRLFHAKDFQSLMYPCLLFCRILGVFPYKIIASTFEASKPHYILGTVIICVHGIYAISLFDSSLFETIDMISLPSILGSTCTLVFGSFITIVTLILSGPRVRLLQIILKISSRLPAESYKKLSRLIHTKDIIGFLCILGIMSLNLMNGLRMNSLIHVHIFLVVFQMDMLYMNCVCVLKICFKRINDKLARVRELMANPFGSMLIYHEQRNPFLILELKALKKQHLTVSDTVQMLNMIFSLQLLATVLITFCNITIILYYYILTWHYILSMSILIKTLFHIRYLLDLMYHITKIALIVWACETGKNQALQITTSIHDILNSITDEQIKEELQLFSLQTLHCENIFSAKGLTGIDAKLLAEIAGSVVMYVFILFQFKHMSCDRKTTNNMT